MAGIGTGTGNETVLGHSCTREVLEGVYVFAGCGQDCVAAGGACMAGRAAEVTAGSDFVYVCIMLA